MARDTTIHGSHWGGRGRVRRISSWNGTGNEYRPSTCSAANFVLLAGPEGAAWCEAGRIEAARLSDVQLDVHRAGRTDLADPENRFCSAYGLPPTGACLVRPDGFVGWRAKASEPDPSASLATALRTLLCRS
jgi:hypothetical protein